MVNHTYNQTGGISLKAISIILAFFITLIAFQASLADDAASIQSFLDAWRNAQLSRQINSLKPFYSPRFEHGDLDFNDWMKEKRSQFKVDGPLSLEISEVDVKSGDGQAEVSCLVQYKGEKISKIGEKTLTLERNNSKWRIVAENWRTVSGFVVTTDSPAPDGANNSKIIIKSISYELSHNNLEKVLIDFNQFYTPSPFVLEKDRPRVVLDIKNTRAWNGPAIIPVNGLWIKRVRSHYYSDKDKLRIVLDLTPSMDYTTKQIFYKAENIYSLEVKNALE